MATVPSIRPSARNVFLPTEAAGTVASTTGFDEHPNFVDKHEDPTVRYGRISVRESIPHHARLPRGIPSCKGKCGEKRGKALYECAGAG